MIAVGGIGCDNTKPSRVLHRDRATYVWPCAKLCCASMIACSNVKPCDLCIVIAQAVFNGNCRKVPATFSSISCVSSFSVYLMLSHFSWSTSIVWPSSVEQTIILSAFKSVTLPIIPLQYLFSGELSFFTNITCAPTFNLRVVSVGQASSGKSPSTDALYVISALFSAFSFSSLMMSA